MKTNSNSVADPAESQNSANTPRKVVSFPPSTYHRTTPVHQSPAHEKILSRKPTPFNDALSATIRNSGLGAIMKEDHLSDGEEGREEEEEEEEEEGEDLDFEFGETVKEEEVGEERALYAKVMSENVVKHAQPPP